MITVKDKKIGKIIQVPELEAEELTADELENLNAMSGMDPHFWGPGYDE
jgi:nitrate reductase NapAB chaperone NapD